MGLQNEYYENMRSVLHQIEDTQESNIEKAAQVVANSITNGGVFHIMDTGHMLMYESVGRSGGLMAVRPLRVQVNVENPVKPRESKISRKQVFMDEIEGLPAYILDRGDVEAGDVLLIGSVTGVKTLPVGLAIAARERQITTIAITSITYSKTLTSRHPSGKRLFEITDLVLDNCCPEGDALVSVDSMDLKVCPASGIGAAYVIWSLQARIVEILLEKGIDPAIYKSHYLPNAAEHNKQAWQQYEKLGY